MNQINKKFTPVEIIIFIVIVLFVVGILYYYFVNVPINRDMRKAEQTIADSQVLTSVLQAQLAELKVDEEKLENIKKSGEKVSVVENYNNSEAEMEYMHEVLGAAKSYSINFSNVVRDGNLIRRNVEILFSTESRENARKIIEQFADCKYRCIVSEIKMSNFSGENKEKMVSVSCKMTFFETIVGGDSDSGLPSVNEEK